ncbi:hypothetical protein CPC08DRAFT_69511 [Agrocybe pediades]|nr:hypothetical protein CPC08DRAFT_69511 [Agrocybe pediades]
MVIEGLFNKKGALSSIATIVHNRQSAVVVISYSKERIIYTAINKGNIYFLFGGFHFLAFVYVYELYTATVGSRH